MHCPEVGLGRFVWITLRHNLNVPKPGQRFNLPMSVGTNLPDLVNVESWDGLNKGHIILGGIQVQSPQTNPFLP